MKNNKEWKRRLIIVVAISFCVIIGQAQEHLCFMDVSFDNSLDVFYNKLASDKGLIASSMTDGQQYSGMETRKLIGEFYGIKNCSFYVRKHERLNNASSVIVEDTLGALGKEDAQRLISLHDQKYGTHKKDSTKYSIWYTWKTVNGEVELGLNRMGFRAFYIDYTEVAVRKAISEEIDKEWERQTVKEICGIPFGSSYEKSKEVLENKYGTYSFLSDKTKIIYENKTYAGISFDDILFLFQSDGYKSYLNGCVFVIKANSLRDAKDKRDLLYRKLSWKYEIKEGIDENGNKYYYGGHSPIPFDGWGFTIEIIKYSTSANSYAARLMYGRYNYVKEEF